MAWNKRGGLDLSALTNGIQAIIQILPGWLKFILFLFMLSFLGYIFTFAFQVFGVYCNSANEPVNVEGFLTGFALMNEVPDLTEVGLDGVEANSPACRQQLGPNDGTFYIPKLQEYREISTQQYYYRGTYCSKCTHGILKDENNKTRTDTGNQDGEYCIDNAYPTPENEKSWWQKVVCTSQSSSFGSCEPPTDYYFDMNSGIYVCENDACASKTIGDKWDETLSEKGAKLLYPEITDLRNPSADNIVGIKCEELRPRLAIYGVDILDFKLVIFGIIIFLLIWLIRFV